MNLILLVILLLLVFGGLPTWKYHSFGWGPSSVGGIVLLVLLVLILTGRL
jgi:Protein of unknown function (DUF3309)